VALTALQNAGYTEVCVFKNRKRSTLPISSVLSQLMMAAVQQPDELGVLASVA
jgi:hypothetical protein